MDRLYFNESIFNFNLLFTFYEKTFKENVLLFFIFNSASSSNCCLNNHSLSVISVGFIPNGKIKTYSSVQFSSSKFNTLIVGYLTYSFSFPSSLVIRFIFPNFPFKKTSLIFFQLFFSFSFQIFFHVF